MQHFEIQAATPRGPIAATYSHVEFITTEWAEPDRVRHDVTRDEDPDPIDVDDTDV